MKRLSFLFLFVSLFVASLGLVSCSDDDNEDLNDAENAIAAQYVGNYSGNDKINVGMGKLSWDYTTDGAVTYRITKNNNGTINVEIPIEEYKDTQIGNINIGSYEIDSLKYNPLTGFTRAYKGSAAKVHFQSTGSQDYPVILNGDYDFESEACVISVTRSTAGVIQVKNIYTLGHSPVLITNSFTGTKL